MIILRALPFSLAILWRYLLVFPFLLIAFAIFGLIALFLVVIFGFVSPLLGILIAMSFSIAFSIVPAMIGTRLGLQSYQLKPRNSYFGLLVPALGYGVLEGIFVLVLLAAGIGVFVLLTPLEVDQLIQMGRVESTQFFAELMALNAQLTLAVTTMGILAVFSLRAALLVPLAGASIGEDANGRAHTPFFGMGQGFWQILLLVILSYVASALVVPFVFYILFHLGYADLVEATSEQIANINDFEDFLDIAFELGVFVAMCVFFYLWAFSLQCAGGVLAYMRNVAPSQNSRLLSEPELAKVLEQTADKTELKAMRRSRMPPQDR